MCLLSVTFNFFKFVCCQWNVNPGGQILLVLFRATILVPTTRSLVKMWDE